MVEEEGTGFKIQKNQRWNINCGWTDGNVRKLRGRVDNIWLRRK